MRKRAAAILDAAIALALFCGTWFTRATQANAFVTWDEPAWVYRSVKFLQALSRGDLAGTMLVGHPGVLTMWSGALSLAWHRIVTHTVSQAQLAAVDALPSLDVHDAATIRQLVALLAPAKGGLIVVHAALIVLLYLLLRRLLDRRYAVVASLFLACDPYFLALSRVLHIDALTSELMLASALAALIHGRGGGRRYLLLSAASAGLAALAKSYGVLVVPFAVAFAATRYLGLRPGRRRLLAVLGAGALWAAVAIGTFFLLWPAMWAAPARTLGAMLGLSLEYATSAGDATTHFFRGRFVGDPGPAFYPVAMLFRTTPLVVAGALLALLSLAVRARDEESDAARRAATAAMAAYVVLYIAIISVSSKKYDRYMLPALLGADLLAALGWAATLDLLLRALGLARGPRAAARRAVSGGLASAFVLLQAAILLAPLYPARYLAYYNPLAGGPAGAVATIPVGWGEGIESVAQYLAARPDARELSVATWAVAGLAPSFPGQVAKLSEEAISTADYVLLYVGDVQGESPLASLFYGKEKPEYVVALNGVEYAWLYRNVHAQELAQELAALAQPGDALIANVLTPLALRTPAGLSCHPIAGTTEAAVASELQAVTAGARHVLYLDYATGQDAPTAYISRQLGQTGLQLERKPFLGGTLYYYLLPAGATFRPAPASTGAEVEWGRQLRLEGYGFSAPVVEYRGALGVGLQWRALQPSAVDYAVFLHLVDEQGRLWGQGDGLLVDADAQRTSAWPAGSSHRCNYSVPVAAGMPPGRYWLAVGVSNPDGSRLNVTSGDQQAWTTEFGLGPIQVQSATIPPRADELVIQHPLTRELGSRIRLLGYELPAESCMSGDSVEVTLYWRCLQPLDAPYELELRLERGAVAVASQRYEPAGPYHPTDRWLMGEVLSWRQSLPVAAEVPTGDYDLSMNLYSRRDGKPLATPAIFLTRLHVEHRERLFTAPEIRFPLQATLGEQIELLGYDLQEDTVTPGQALHLTLYWRALRRPDASYTVFTHLLDAQGTLRGQRDSAPVGGERPTSGWVAGEIVVDPYELPANADASPGRYQIEIGLYDAGTGKRLPLTRDSKLTGEDRVLLPAVVTVE